MTRRVLYIHLCGTRLAGLRINTSDLRTISNFGRLVNDIAPMSVYDKLALATALREQQRYFDELPDAYRAFTHFKRDFFVLERKS